MSSELAACLGWSAVRVLKYDDGIWAPVYLSECFSTQIYARIDLLFGALSEVHGNGQRLPGAPQAPLGNPLGTPHRVAKLHLDQTFLGKPYTMAITERLLGLVRLLPLCAF